MKTRAAVLWEIGGKWSVEEIDLDPPGFGEVLVTLTAAGMCHSDEHLVTGDLPFPLPMIGGHEGAGVVTEVGDGVRSVAPGDHVVFAFIPACGRCPSCATGHSNLCDQGAQIGLGRQVAGGYRHHSQGRDLGLMCMVGTFAEHTVVNESQVIKVEPHHDLSRACLVGCGVTTGWGSAVYAAETMPGDTVVVVGAGGIGMNVIQGARHAGARRIVAIDPVEFKREKALEFGATHTFASMDEALVPLQQLTWGRMAERLILTMGVGNGALMASAMALLGKRGRCVITNLGNAFDTEVTMSLVDITLLEKQVVGSLFGSGNPRFDVPNLLALAEDGQLDLNGLVTREYTLDEVNEGYDDLREGRLIRGVIRF